MIKFTKAEKQIWFNWLQPSTMNLYRQDMVRRVAQELQEGDCFHLREHLEGVSSSPSKLRALTVENLESYVNHGKGEEKPQHLIVASFLAAAFCASTRKKAKLVSLFTKTARDILESKEPINAKDLEHSKHIVGQLIRFELPQHPKTTLLGKALRAFTV